jgi:hypothetical protein
VSRRTKALAVEFVDNSLLSPAQSRRVFYESIKHWLKIERRATDRFKDFARSRLLLAGLGQLPGLLRQGCLRLLELGGHL